MSTPIKPRHPSLLASSVALVIPFAAIVSLLGDEERAQSMLLVAIAVLLLDLAIR